MASALSSTVWIIEVTSSFQTDQANQNITLDQPNLLPGAVSLREPAAPWGDQQAQAMLLRQKGGNVGMAGSTGLWARDGDRIINAKASLLKQVGDHNQVQLADVRVFTFTADGQLTRFDWAQGAVNDGGQWTLQKVRSSLGVTLGNNCFTSYPPMPNPRPSIGLSNVSILVPRLNFATFPVTSRGRSQPKPIPRNRSAAVQSFPAIDNSFLQKWRW